MIADGHESNEGTTATANWVDQKKFFWLFNWIYIGQQTERRKSILIKEIPLRFAVSGTILKLEYMAHRTSIVFVDVMCDNITLMTETQCIFHYVKKILKLFSMHFVSNILDGCTL